MANKASYMGHTEPSGVHVYRDKGQCPAIQKGFTAYGQKKSDHQDDTQMYTFLRMCTVGRFEGYC
jgi:hypothetical protein